ncbi:MAG: hypothetical protein LAN71_06740 [Acidobacteriia bacterium]|nr:hypothetical protein [Terriglobia bacterium]
MAGALAASSGAEDSPRVNAPTPIPPMNEASARRTTPRVVHRLSGDFPGDNSVRGEVDDFGTESCLMFEVHNFKNSMKSHEGVRQHDCQNPKNLHFSFLPKNQRVTPAIGEGHIPPAAIPAAILWNVSPSERHLPQCTESRFLALLHKLGLK